jgi:hypothetical protein
MEPPAAIERAGATCDTPAAAIVFEGEGLQVRMSWRLVAALAAQWRVLSSLFLASKPHLAAGCHSTGQLQPG